VDRGSGWTKVQVDWYRTRSRWNGRIEAAHGARVVVDGRGGLGIRVIFFRPISCTCNETEWRVVSGMQSSYESFVTVNQPTLVWENFP
jgi:hypothetical protein